MTRSLSWLSVILVLHERGLRGCGGSLQEIRQGPIVLAARERRLSQEKVRVG